MATYIHDNYKNTVALTMGYTQASTTTIKNASGSSFYLSTSYTGAVQYMYLIPTSRTVGNNYVTCFLSTSDAVLTNEYTCPDLATDFVVNKEEGISTAITMGKSTHTWQIVNTAGTAKTFKKLAIYRTTNNNSNIVEHPEYFFLLFVIDLDSPLTLQPNEAGVISFTMDFSKLGEE